LRSCCCFVVFYCGGCVTDIPHALETAPSAANFRAPALEQCHKDRAERACAGRYSARQFSYGVWGYASGHAFQTKTQMRSDASVILSHTNIKSESI
jgi:hypothetical protein